jgi:hypothetical protein
MRRPTRQSAAVRSEAAELERACRGSFFHLRGLRTPSGQVESSVRMDQEAQGTSCWSCWWNRTQGSAPLERAGTCTSLTERRAGPPTTTSPAVGSPVATNGVTSRSWKDRNGAERCGARVASDQSRRRTGGREMKAAAVTWKNTSHTCLVSLAFHSSKSTKDRRPLSEGVLAIAK